MSGRAPLVLLALAALRIGAVTATPATALPASGRAVGPEAALDKAVSTAVARLGIPGVSVALVIGSERTWIKSYGFADLENQVEATPETMFRLASSTKPITAVAVLQLVVRNKLDLNAPIQRYVPSFPEKPWPITLRDLLAHQSGLRHWQDEEWGHTRHYRSIAESLEMFAQDPLVFEPGTRAQYSSPGYNLLGAAIEGASGEDYLTYLREQVFEPADLASLRADDAWAIIPNRAAGYARLADGSLRNSRLSDTSNKLPAGGLIGTAGDLAGFGAALLGGSLLARADVRRMCTTQRTREGKPTGYGLGLRVGTHRGELECWHQGGQPQVSTLLYLQPRRDLSIAILCNLEGLSGELLDLARQIAEIARRTAPAHGESAQGAPRSPLHPAQDRP